MTWLTASTKRKTLEVGATAGRRVVRPTTDTPDGDIHAYRDGDDLTPCGLQAGPLHKWPMRFTASRCQTCTQAATDS